MSKEQQETKITEEQEGIKITEEILEKIGPSSWEETWRETEEDHLDRPRREDERGTKTSR